MKQLEQNNSNIGPTKRGGCQLDELLVLKIQETFTSLIPKGYENAFRSVNPKIVIEKVLEILYLTTPHHN